MDSTNDFKIAPGPSATECATNLRSDEISTTVQASEVSGTITVDNSKNCDERSTKQTTEEEKPILKRKKFPEERQPLKRKKNNPLPISQMVMESIRGLKKRNGASLNAILEYMEGQYKVNAKLVKRYVSKYLLSAVEKGTVERLGDAGNDGRYKIKRVEKIQNAEQKSKGNQKMAKAGKIAKVGDKLNDSQKKIKAEKVAKVGQKPNQKKIKAEKVAKVGQKPNQKKIKGRQG